MKKLMSLSMAFLFAGSLLAAKASHMANHFNRTSDAEQVGISFFDGTWSEALAKAKEEKKLIFMDAYAAWCGPCKRMAQLTFTDQKVGDYFNANFISYKMDMEKHAEGPRLSTKYGLTAYPTLYFVNHDESVVHTSVGYLDPAGLISVGEAAKAKN